MKKKRIEIRVSEFEKSKLKSLAGENDKTVSEYILDCSLGKYSTKSRTKIALEIKKLEIKNLRIGNNINQLSKRVNSNQNLSRSDFEKFEQSKKEHIKSVSEQTKRLMKLYKLLSI